MVEKIDSSILQPAELRSLDAHDMVKIKKKIIDSHRQNPGSVIEKVHVSSLEICSGEQTFIQVQAAAPDDKIYIGGQLSRTRYVSLFAPGSRSILIRGQRPQGPGFVSDLKKIIIRVNECQNRPMILATATAHFVPNQIELKIRKAIGLAQPVTYSVHLGDGNEIETSEKRILHSYEPIDKQKKYYTYHISIRGFGANGNEAKSYISYTFRYRPEMAGNEVYTERKTEVASPSYDISKIDFPSGQIPKWARVLK